MLVYLISSCCTDTCKYINNLVELTDVMKRIKTAIKLAPYWSFHITCYHWEERTITEKDSEGNETTRTESYKVNTHSASQKFDCSAFVD